MDLAASPVVSWMFCCFERSCPLREIWPPDWNLSLVLQRLSRPPFEPLNLASVKHLAWKMSFLPALASAKRVNELHSLCFRVHHSHSWRSYTFSFLPDFVAKTQNPSVHDPQFEEFTVPFLDNFVDGDWDKLLLCLIRALHEYLSRAEQYHPGIEWLFISTGMQKKRVLRNTISFWLCSWFCLLMRPLRRRIVSLWGLGLTNSGWLQHLCFLRGTAWSIRCWRQGLCQPSLPSPSTWEMLLRGTWTRSPLGLWWWLSKSCNLLTCFDSSVVTLCIGLSQRLYLRLPDSYILRVVMCLLLLLLSLYSSDLRPESYRSLTLENLW